MVVLNVLGCWSFITPKMLGLLFKAFYSMISMCAEDSSSLALVLAHAAPIHSEPAVALPLDGHALVLAHGAAFHSEPDVALPLNRRLCTFGHTYPRASRIDHTRSTVIMPQPCDSWAEPAQDFAEHKQPQGRRTFARSTFLMWRILNSEYTSTC